MILTQLGPFVLDLFLLQLLIFVKLFWKSQMGGLNELHSLNLHLHFTYISRELKCEYYPHFDF